jgi:hypothetical protein
MPARNDHETQWDSNHRLLVQLERQNAFPDWVVTVAFYAALHSLERFLALRNKHPTDHLDRKNLLLSYEPQLSHQILRDYLDMYSMSIAARYECISPALADVQEQRARLARIDAKVGPLV